MLCEAKRVIASGEYVKRLMEEANLNPTTLGRKINKVSNTAKDILERESIDSELLLAISNAVIKMLLHIMMTKSL